MFILLAPLWIVFAIITTVIAVNKGRSGFAWFFVGLFLGFIGIILALVVSRHEDVLESKAVATGEFRKCPFCAEIIKSEALRCKHCSADVSASVPPPPAPGPTLDVSIERQGGKDYLPAAIAGLFVLGLIAWAALA